MHRPRPTESIGHFLLFSKCHTLGVKREMAVFCSLNDLRGTRLSITVTTIN